MFITTRYEIGDSMVRPWNCLIEAKIQGQTFHGTITCHSGDEEKAKKLALITFANYLRRAGIWAYTEDQKEDEKVHKIYHAPTLDHIKFVSFVDLGSQDLTFPASELEYREQAATQQSFKKRRTSNEVALDEKKKKQEKVASAGNKLQPIVEYFTTAKTLKQAAKDLGISYQVIRYRLNQIKSTLVDDVSYDVIIDDSKGAKTAVIKRRPLQP